MTPAWRYGHVRDYLTFCRWAFATTASGWTIQYDWTGEPLDAEGWRRSFLRALDRRINLKAGPEPCWRKLDERYQTDLARDCRAIRDRVTRQIALHSLTTSELRRRFGHLLSSWED